MFGGNKTLRRSLIGKVSVRPKRADTSYCPLLVLWLGQHTEANEDKNKHHEKINSQSLEDTQVGYISQEYTLEKYTQNEQKKVQKCKYMDIIF